jgi:hypothetical protein
MTAIRSFVSERNQVVREIVTEPLRDNEAAGEDALVGRRITGHVICKCGAPLRADVEKCGLCGRRVPGKKAKT